jgi:hypothetical protein
MFNRNLIMEMVRHDPLMIVGLLLVGSSSWLSVVVLRRLLDNGYKFRGYFEMWPMIGTMPLAYLHLQARKQNGWSAWPAYLIWIFAIAGLAALVAGLFRLRLSSSLSFVFMFPW